MMPKGGEAHKRPCYALLVLAPGRRRLIQAWLADPALSPVQVRDRILERFAMMFEVADLIAFHRAYNLDEDTWLRAKDIAAREKRTERWARTHIHAGDFGETKCIGARILEVRESGYLAWLERGMKRSGSISDQLSAVSSTAESLPPVERVRVSGGGVVQQTAGVRERRSRARALEGAA